MADRSEHQAWLARLRQALGGPLPGREAQYRMAARRSDSAPPVGPEAGVDRRSGVLILFYPHAGELWFPLAVRVMDGGPHAGQVCLPGGRVSPEDADLVATALREAWEEAGILRDQVEVLGCLTPLYVPHRREEVTPAVGWSPDRPHFRPQPTEIARLCEIPLRALRDPATRTYGPERVRGQMMEVPCFLLGDLRVWGITAMILSELLAVLEADLPIRAEAVSPGPPPEA